MTNNCVTCSTFALWNKDIILGPSVLSYNEIKSEIIGGNDNKLRTKAVARSKIDILGEADNKLRLKHFHRIKTDIFGEVDNKLRLKSLTRVKTDVLGGIDSKERMKEIYRELSDLFDAIDNRSRIKIILREFEDYIEGYDTKFQGLGKLFFFSEVVESLDIMVRTKTLERIFGDIIGSIDDMIRTKLIVMIFTDFIESLDIEIHSKTLQRFFIDLIGGLDSKSVGYGISRVFTDLVGGLDTAIIQWGKVFTELLDFIENPPNCVHPYAKWHMNESSGTIAYDSSPNGRNGTTVGSPTWVAGKLNNSISLNGTSQYVNCGDIGNFERTDPFSVEIWTKLNGEGYRGIIGRSEGTATNKGWSIFAYNGYVYIRLCNSYYTKYAQAWTSTRISYNTWRHVVVTYNGNSSITGVKMYIDGVLQTLNVQSDTLTDSMQNTGTCKIGMWGYPGYPGYFLGLIDEARIYNFVLTQAQVTSQYNSGTGTESDFITSFHLRVKSIFRAITDKLGELDIKRRIKALTRIKTESIGGADWWYDPIANMYGIWHLNENSGTIAYDSTLNSNDLVFATGIGGGQPPDITWVPAKLNNGCHIGSGSRLSGGERFPFERNEPWTLEMWFKPGVVNPTDFMRRIEGAYIIPDKAGYECVFEWAVIGDPKWGTLEGRLQMVLRHSLTNGIKKYWLWGPYWDRPGFESDHWYHLVFTYDGSSTAAGCKCYVNGVELTDSVVVNDNLSESMISPYDNFMIGYVSGTMSQTIDEVVLWGRVLTIEQILDRYNNGEGRELTYYPQFYFLIMEVKDMLLYRIFHGIYHPDLTGMRDIVISVIRHGMHHGHQHWWKDKPKQKVVIGE